MALWPGLRNREGLCAQSGPHSPLANRQEEGSTLSVHTQIHETTQTSPLTGTCTDLGSFCKSSKNLLHACNTWAQQTAIKESLMSLNRKVLMDVRGLSAKVGHTYIIGKHRICRIFRTFAFDCPVKEIHCHQSLYQGYKDLSICGGSLL